MAVRGLGVVAVLGLALAGCGSSDLTDRSNASGDTTAGPTPCSSPYASDDVSVSIPKGSRELHISVLKGAHVVIGWSVCGESGEIRSSGSGLEVTDAGSLSKGGPTVYVRYLADKEGTVTITGEGSKGSHGKVFVTVSP